METLGKIFLIIISLAILAGGGVFPFLLSLLVIWCIERFGIYSKNKKEKDDIKHAELIAAIRLGLHKKD